MRAYELDELTAYFGKQESSAWKFFAPAFEHLSDEQGKPRIAFTWLWPGFILGPCYLFARKSYLVSFVVLGLALLLGSVHVGAFFAIWCACAVITPYFMLRRFLRVVEICRAKDGDREQHLKNIADEGGFSAWIGVLEMLP